MTGPSRSSPEPRRVDRLRAVSGTRRARASAVVVGRGGTDWARYADRDTAPVRPCVRLVDAVAIGVSRPPQALPLLRMVVVMVAEGASFCGGACPRRLPATSSQTLRAGLQTAR